MRLTYRVQKAWLRGEQAWVRAHAKFEGHGNYSNWNESNGIIEFQVPQREARNWWAGRIFELEIPFTPVELTSIQSHPELTAIENDDSGGVLEEVGRGESRGLFGRLK